MTKKKQQIAPNLLLHTRSNGRSFYIARFKKNGRSYERSLGCAEDITLRTAKLALARLLMDFEEPSEEKKNDHPDGLCFREAFNLAMKDIAAVKQWKNEKSEHTWRQTITDFALPIIGDLDVAGITRDDVLAVLKPIWFEKTETASRLRARIEAVLSWSIRRGYRKESNPAIWKGNLEFDLPMRMKIQPVEHFPAMTGDEIKKVVTYCLAHPSPVSAAVLFGIATASRLSEFRLAKRKEIDGDVWLVPPERRKDKRNYPHRVPLSTLAQEALKMADDALQKKKKGDNSEKPKKANGDDFLFVSRYGVIHVDSPRLKIVDIVGRKVTMHGCRSTFRDWCAENNINQVLAEKSLMHTTGNEVEQAYQRSDLLEQRKVVMQQWSDFLTGF